MHGDKINILLCFWYLILEAFPTKSKTSICEKVSKFYFWISQIDNFSITVKKSLLVVENGCVCGSNVRKCIQPVSYFSK